MNVSTTLLTDSTLSATDDANGEKFVDDSALQILVQVALEFGRAERLAFPLREAQFCAPQRDASPLPRQQRPLSTAKFVRLSEHGNAWSFRDNVVLWRAYEAWQRNGSEIQEWRTARANVAECSFPFYAHEKFFATRRTLVGVRKHFFKLKRRKFGQVLREQQTASMSAASGKHSGVTISIPKSVWTRCAASPPPPPLPPPPPPPAMLAPDFEPSTPLGIAKGLYSQTTTSDDETCDTAPAAAYGAESTAARRAVVFFRNNKSSAADAVASDCDESSDGNSDNGQDAFSRTFLRISQQSLARRKRKRYDLVGGTPLKIAKPASSELMYREIVQRARWRALRE
jgi:hypothetical protein